MDDKFTPIVITSRAAEKDIAKIRNEHSRILNDLQNHQQRVSVYHQSKQVQNANDKKSAMDFSLKQQELASKLNKSNG